MKGWLVLVHGHKQSRCSNASSETRDFKQRETQLLFSAFSPSQATLTSVLQFSLMGDPLSREQQTPSPQNTSVLGAIPPSFTLAQTGGNTFVLDGITLMWRRTQGTFGLCTHCSISEEVLVFCRKTITAALFSYEPRACIPKEYSFKLQGMHPW